MIRHSLAGRQPIASIPRGSIVAPYCCVGKGGMAMQKELTYEGLNAKRLANEDTFPDILRLRARRCTSWLEPAEKAMASRDYDAAFIFYWIAFNAAYSEGSSDTRSEIKKRNDFLNMVIKLDKSEKLHNAILMRYQGPINSLLNNEYVYERFWRHYSGRRGYGDWEFKFRIESGKVRTAIARGNTRYILRILFERLYVLRNQFIHGGTTWKGSVNRAQVTDGAMIMASLVPLFIELMMDNPDIPWPPPPFPLVPDPHERRQHSV